MQDIQSLLEQSLEDFSISRSERKEIKAAFAKISGQTAEQAIADGQALLNGSFNWTRSATSENCENILVTDDPIVVKKYVTEFNRLWKSLTS